MGARKKKDQHLIRERAEILQDKVTEIFWYAVLLSRPLSIVRLFYTPTVDLSFSVSTSLQFSRHVLFVRY